MLRTKRHWGGDRNARLAELVDELHDVYGRLRDLVGMEADAVVHLPTATTYILPETQRELVRIEAMERERAAERAAIIDALPASIAILDRNGDITDVNRAWRKFGADNGGGADQTLGRSYFGVLGCGKPGTDVARGLRSVLAGQSEHFAMEYECHSPERERWFLVTIAPLGGHRLGGAVVMHVDITEHYLTSRRADELNVRIERLIDQAPIGILVHAAFKPLLANKELVRILGFSTPDQILTMDDCSKLFDAPDRAAFKQFGTSLTEGDAAPFIGHLQVTGSDGQITTLEGRFFRIKWGTEFAVCVMLADVTRQLQIQEQLRLSSSLQAIGQLTGGIAHDFNNLLTVILGSAELLIEKLSDPQLLGLAQATAKMAERGASLTQRLLAFAQQQPLDPEIIDMNERIDAMDDLLRRSLGDSIQICIQRAAQLWSVEIDASEFDNAILNLCINARDAMPKGGQLTIATENVDFAPRGVGEDTATTCGPHVLVSVSDDGVGMDAATIKRIFEPFFTTKVLGTGTGLGMSRVYGFVKQSRGQILVSSTEGQGSTVRMYFPKATVLTDRPKGPLPEPHKPKKTSGARILAVEDDEVLRPHVTRQLQALGYQVVAVGTALDALAVLRRDGAFDLLFTDIVMPGGMTGLELAAEVAGFLPGLPVLFTSGYYGMDQVSVHPGISLLQKPYLRQDLATMVLAAMGASAA